MTITEIPVTKFKARCTALLREVAGGRHALRVTNHGKVVALIQPPVNGGKAPDPKDFFGSGRGTVLRYESPLTPALPKEAWHATQ